MNRPLVSLLMPCFNAAKTLAESLDSLCRQTFSELEILVCDDGSRDDTLKIAESFAQSDPRIRVFRSGHEGLVSALQRLSAEASGIYFARMDADDIAHPSRIEEQVRYMETHPEVGVCGTLVTMSGAENSPGVQRYEGWINALIEHDDIEREFFVECPIAHPTFCMRRSAFEAVGGYEDRGWAEDYDLLMRFHERGFRFGKVSEALLTWRHYEDRTSLTDPRYGFDQFRALKRHYLQRIYLGKRPTLYQWGAGVVGKKWLREWGGSAPKAVVDLHPRKIGERIHDCLVIAPDALPPPGEAFTVIAVGAPGAREEIRAWFTQRRYVELEDFLFLS